MLMLVAEFREANVAIKRVDKDNNNNNNNNNNNRTKNPVGGLASDLIIFGSRCGLQAPGKSYRRALIAMSLSRRQMMPNTSSKQ
ncbi:hypothetical protein BO70DRAFT_78107 [Aspergillus heteromorphus CBS 117.55]|uniref:Uncharacterized protein n=1 Tax=Aspergillus heteromorphus CBS 117.55 TaxID=1448321 RepID=A0A317WWN2_9EURO|nr:uncharacterized protein BO70DRAFT_78107 [Aspergillus heteromorphus CBS 117.55]PWY90779.1 hypothetical protein BO70DRAFT_78107 [Aspergillus heteromorphus CBS 117.55]